MVATDVGSLLGSFWGKGGGSSRQELVVLLTCLRKPPVCVLNTERQASPSHHQGAVNADPWRGSELVRITPHWSNPMKETKPGNQALWTRCRIIASRRTPLRDRFEDLQGVRPFPAVELGVDHLVVEGDLEGRPPSALKIDTHPAGEPVGNRLPETSGLGEIPSNCAVLDRDHADSVVGRGYGLTSPGVAAGAPRSQYQSKAASSSATAFSLPWFPLVCSGPLLPVPHLQPGNGVVCDFCGMTVEVLLPPRTGVAREPYPGSPDPRSREGSGAVSPADATGRRRTGSATRGGFHDGGRMRSRADALNRCLWWATSRPDSAYREVAAPESSPTALYVLPVNEQGLRRYADDPTAGLGG